MLHQARPVVLRLDLPELLEADAEFRRLAVLRKSNRAISCLASEPRAPSAISMYFARSAMPGVKAGLVLRRLCATPMSPVATPTTAPFSIEQHLGRRKARIDLDAERLGLGRQPAADVAERDDVIAVVVHQRRHQKFGKRNEPERPSQRKRSSVTAVLNGLSPSSPSGQQPVDADRIDHGAGQDMRADLGALFQHDHGDLGIELLQADRRREPGRPGADDHHVEFHRSRAGKSAMNFSHAILYFCTWGGNRVTSMLVCINGPWSRKIGARSARILYRGGC